MIYPRAYRFFEQKRILDGKPKTAKRLEQENRWGLDGKLFVSFYHAKFLTVTPFLIVRILFHPHENNQVSLLNTMMASVGHCVDNQRTRYDDAQSAYVIKSLPHYHTNCFTM